MAESIVPNLEVDGAHFIEHGDICEMCENTASVGYCSECECYICQLCFDNHIKIKKNNHHILQIAPEGKEDDRTIHFKTCTEHTQQEVRLYCTDHKCFGCGECMLFNHKSCKCKYITEASKEFQDSGELARFLEDIQDIENIHANCVELIASESKQSSNVDKTVINDVQKFVKDVVSYVTDEEKRIIKNADSKKSENDDKVEKLSNDLQRIGSDITSLSTKVRSEDEIHILFILAMEMKPKLCQIRDTLASIDCQDAIDRYTFYPNRLIQRQFSEKRPLGKLSDTQSEGDDEEDYERKYKTEYSNTQWFKEQLSIQEKKSNRLEQQLSTQQDENQRFKKQLTHQQDENQRLKQQLSTQQQEDQRLKQQLAINEQDNKQLKQQLTIQEQDNKQLNQQLSTQQQDNKRLQQQLSTQEEHFRLKLSTQTQDNQRLHQQLTTQQHDIIRLQQQLLTQEQTLKQLQNQFILTCGHTCDIGQMNENRTIKCPTCGVIYGDQPDGTFRAESKANYTELKFKFDKGTQSKLNLNSGKPYEGNEVTGYVDNDEDGSMILNMLELAFDRKLLFTINTNGHIVTNGIDIFTCSVLTVPINASCTAEENRCVRYSDATSRKTYSRKKLSVESTSKIDRTLHQNISYRHRPSTWVVVIKWVSTFVLGALLLACVTESKLSIVALSQRMNTGDSLLTEERSRIFVKLQLLLLIPNAVNMIRGIWSGSFREDIPWPRKKSLIAAVFVSFLESLGLVLFVFNVPGLVTKPYFTVLLMSCVFLVPLLYSLCTSYQHNTRSLWKSFVTIALLLELAGMGIVGFLIGQSESGSDIGVFKLIMIPIALLCLSFAWLPWVQEYLLKKTVTESSVHEELEEDNGMAESHFVESRAESINPNRSSSGYQHNISVGSEQATRGRNYGTMPSTSENLSSKATATWKLIAFMSFWKIIFTIALSMLIFNVNEINAFKIPQGISMSDYWSGWNWQNAEHKETYYFVSNLITSIVGYLCGYMACTACMQRLAFTLPLLLASPLSVVLLYVRESCNWLLSMNDVSEPCTDNSNLKIHEHILPFVALVMLVSAQALSSAWLIFRKHTVVMLKEDQLFWVPMYNSPMLEQWILLTRKNVDSKEWNEDTADKAKRSKVIICTTMYRETDYEMKQLLESIQGINIAQNDGERHFESHVFFDGAVKDRHPTEFVLQLVSLVESTLGVKAVECTKTLTPYGMTLTWTLTADPGKRGMIFMIHLKDNFKVKNKKRWSQVMYMSYVLDFLMNQMDDATDDETYILTTDADVRFTPDSVEALLDFMTRDHRVGAVCARTHPLGSGPLVWYQVFEYAIGHWFQKAAEHVLGSVLCSTGCFSVYRCKAIRDIIPQYASNVEHAYQFLTKDMGEDRWFCTLMVQSGWRVEYCAASENSTHCPEDFDEFFKQRRRWVASTLANLMLLIKEWHIIARLNHRVSFVFLIYQTILLFATLIGPSSVILVISGGLQYAWKTGGTAALVIQLIACVVFTFICLTASSKTQLNVAKFFTFAYAVVMTAVVVGTAVQIATDFDGSESSKVNFISDTIRVSTTTVYIATMASMFVTAGILHLREIFFLMHGVWYLLCLPAGYLILMIYSICNITDRSWGTREVKTHSVLSKQLSWQDTVTNAFKNVFFCCFERSEKKSVSVQTEQLKNRTSRSASRSESGKDSQGVVNDHGAVVTEDVLRSICPNSRLSAIAENESPRTYGASEFAKYDYDVYDDNIDSDTVADVKDWLPQDMKQLAPNFIQNGFENTMLISGMTEKELKDIGIKRKGMKKYLMEEIKKLPDYEIQAEVPENVHQWLNIVGLQQYESNFKKEKIEHPKDMEVLKSFSRTELEKELNITKSGHIKRLMYAIRRLRNPTKSELKLMEVKKALMVPISYKLKDINKDENEFWENLRSVCLLPQSTAFGLDDDLKAKLGGLRNSWLMIFAVSNALWLILIFTLAEQGELLTVLGSNPIGLVVLLLFGLVLIIQFLAMIVHRITTLAHFLGRAPYKSGDTYNTTWAFNDSDIKTSSDDDDAEQLKRFTIGKAKHKLRTRTRKRPENDIGERTPLTGASNSHIEIV